MGAASWRPSRPATGRSRTTSAGYGRSPAPTAPYRLHEDLVGLLDALGIERAALVGNSMGGKIAIDAALADPDRVSALVLVGAAVSGCSFRAYSDEQGERAEAAWNAGDYRGAADVWLEVWAPLVDRTIREIAYANAAVDDDELELDGDPPAVGPARRARRAGARAPGRHRGAGHRRHAADARGRCAGARLELIGQADHLPNLRRPDEFDRLVLDFLAR